MTPGFCCCSFFQLLEISTKNVRIQHKDHNHLTLEVDHCFCKVKINSPRRGYSSPGNSIFLEIEVALLFISVTNSCHFGAHLLKCIGSRVPFAPALFGYRIKCYCCVFLSFFLSFFFFFWKSNPIKLLKIYIYIQASFQQTCLFS